MSRVVQMTYQPADPRLVHAEVIDFDELRRLNGGGSQRCDFLVVGFVDGGTGVVRVDFQDYPLGAGDIAWIAPGAVHEWSTIDAIRGRLLLCLPSTPLTAAARHVASSIRVRAVFAPDARESAFVGLALDHLAAETARDAPEHSADVEAGLLTALLARMPFEPRIGPDDSVFEQFRDQLEADFRAHRDVAHYAGSLGVSARTLTRTSVASTGVSARHVIEERVVLEAKRLLLHHRTSSTACAALLGFPDPSSFSKYFSRVTGVRPGAWLASQTAR